MSDTDITERPRSTLSLYSTRLSEARWVVVAAIAAILFVAAFSTVSWPYVAISVLGVADLTQMGKVYASGSFRFFETYSIVAYIYLILTIGLSLALRRLERRMRRSYSAG